MSIPFIQGYSSMPIPTLIRPISKDRENLSSLIYQKHQNSKKEIDKQLEIIKLQSHYQQKESEYIRQESINILNGTIQMYKDSQKLLENVLMMIQIDQRKKSGSNLGSNSTITSTSSLSSSSIETSSLDNSPLEVSSFNTASQDIDSIASSGVFSDLEMGTTSVSSSSASTSSMSSSLFSIPSTNQYQSRDLESHPSFSTDSSSESSLFSLATPSLNTPFSDAPLDLTSQDRNPMVSFFSSPFNTEAMSDSSISGSGLSSLPSGLSKAPTKKYPCDYPGCLNGFQSKRSLTRHKKKKHEGKQPPKKCPFLNCEKRCDDSQQLLRHMRKHTGERPFVCSKPECGKAFADSANCKRHEDSHKGIKKYECPICFIRYSKKNTLVNHQKKEEHYLQ